MLLVTNEKQEQKRPKKYADKRWEKKNAMHALKTVLCCCCLKNCEDEEICLKEQKVLLCKGLRMKPWV